MELSTFVPFGIGAAAFGSAVLLLMACVQALRSGRSQTRDRLDRYTRVEDVSGAGEGSSSALRDRSLSRFSALNRFLSANPMAQKTAFDLAQAKLPLKVGEYLLLRVFCSAVAAYLLFVLGGNVLAVVPGAALGYFAPRFYVARRKGQRTRALEAQLVDALALSANSLRAGWGFTQAMTQIATEMPPPISEEFNQALQEISIGATPEDAITGMVKRVGSYDVELVMTGVLIQRQIGGNLAEMMDNTVKTIRERVRLLGDIQSLIAESRLSMWLLSILPVGILLLMTVTMPDYTLPFLEDPRGRLMLGTAAALEVVGVIIMKKISAIEV